MDIWWRMRGGSDKVDCITMPLCLAFTFATPTPRLLLAMLRAFTFEGHSLLLVWKVGRLLLAKGLGWIRSTFDVTYFIYLH